MKKLFALAMIISLAACKSSTKETNTVAGKDTGNTTTVADQPATNNPDAGTATFSYTPEGSAGMTTRASILVQLDKSNLSPNNKYFGMITANGDNKQDFSFNFIFSPKPGVYPVVGLGLTREKQVFGGLLGGTERLTGYNVNITECTDLGANESGGHKWKISGNVNGEITIPAMKIMLMDKTHPTEIKVSNISFANLVYDDNWDELMKDALGK